MKLYSLLTFDLKKYISFQIIQAFLPDMIARNEGHIVALSSCAGLFGLPNLVPYCGTKFAVRGLMEVSKCELRKKVATNLSFLMLRIFTES